MNKFEIFKKKGKVVRLFYKTIFLTIFIVFILSYMGAGNVSGTETTAKVTSFSDSTGGGIAAPLAPYKSDAEQTFKRLYVNKQQWLAGLPSKKELGIPVYPDAVIVGYNIGAAAGENYPNSPKVLSKLNLVSPASLKKIEKWYVNKLPGWKHFSSWHVFIPPHKKVDIMSDKFDATRHVKLEKITSKDQFTGNFLKQPDNAKTAIFISY